MARCTDAFLAALWCAYLAACGPPAHLVVAERSGTHGSFTFDLRSLDALELPDTSDKHWVKTTDHGIALLVDDRRDTFVVLGGPGTRTYRKPHVNPEEEESEPVNPGPSPGPELAPREVVPRGSFKRFRDDAEALSALRAMFSRGTSSDLELFVFVAVLQRKGQTEAASELLQQLPHSAMPLEKRVRESVAGYLAHEAVERWIRGGPEESFARTLTRAASVAGTEGAAFAGPLLASLSVPRSNKPKAPLEAVVDRQVEAMFAAPCGRAGLDVWPMIGLGFNAHAALLASKDDARPSRCLRRSPRLQPVEVGENGGGICEIDPSTCSVRPAPWLVAEPLLTRGELARDVLAQTASQGATGSFDPTDLECDLSTAELEFGRGSPLAVVYAALERGDIPAAIAIGRTALGRLRLLIVEHIAESAPDAPATQEFLVNEATTGSVVAARLKAAEILRRSSNREWASTWGTRTAPDIGAALRAGIWSRLRCDHEVVFDAFGLLLDVAPSDALALLRAALDKTYDASVWTHVLEALHPDAWLPREDIHLRERDAILLRLLDNHRYDGSPRRRGSHFKHCRSPADAAAHLLGLSTHVPFDCHASDAKQHAAIREIKKRMKAASSR